MPTNWLEAQTQLTDRRDMLAALLVLDSLVLDAECGDIEPELSSDALELGAVERALERIEDGTFGACELCAGEIEQERLGRVPWSRCCAPCVAFAERELRAVAADPGECADCAAEQIAAERTTEVETARWLRAA